MPPLHQGSRFPPLAGERADRCAAGAGSVLSTPAGFSTFVAASSDPAERDGMPPADRDPGVELVEEVAAAAAEIEILKPPGTMPWRHMPGASMASSSLRRMVRDARAGATRLRDGRALAFAEWGPVEGRPVLHFHGVPDGRFSWGGGSGCVERGIRLITVDRPGIGGSDPKPDRSVAEWPADVEELAEKLELDRFAVSGWSAGGAYALACAAELGRRIDAVALVGASGRLDLPGFVGQMSTAAAWRLAKHVPSAMTFTYFALAQLARRSPWAAQKVIAAGASKADRAVISRPDSGLRLVSAYVEASRPGGRGLTEDMQAMLSPWGFDPSEIELPVHLVHGKRDTVAPPAHAKYWIETLADARIVWIADAGHFLIEDHVEDVLDTLTR